MAKTAKSPGGREREKVTIAIDAVGAKHGGAASVAMACVEAALSRRGIDAVVVYASPSGMRRFAFPSSERLSLVEVKRAEAGPLGRLWWLTRGVSSALRRLQPAAALFLGGGGVAPEGTRGIVFVQQSLPFSEEAKRTLGARDRLRMAALVRVMKWSSNRAAAIVVQTETMKRNVLDAFGTRREVVHVIRPGAHPGTAGACAKGEVAAMRASEEGSRLLYVGNTSAYKNLGNLVAAVAIARERRRGLQLFATIEPEHALAKREGVVGLGYLGAKALEEAYGLATALVMPSLVETVGLPMLEAMATGVPVVAADRPYAHEVCGEAGLFFDPQSPGDIAEKLLCVTSEPQLRAQLSERGVMRARALNAENPYGHLIEVVLGTTSRSRGWEWVH